MNLKLTVKKDILDKLKITEYFYAVNFDIYQNKFVHGLLVVDSEKIYLIINNNLINTFTIKDFERFKMEETFEGGYLVGYKSEKQTIIVCCSKHYYEKIASVCLGLELYLQENYMAISDIAEKHCPRCGTPFLKGTQICPYCGKSNGAIKTFLPFVFKYKWLIILQYIFVFLTIIIQIIRPKIFEKIVDGYLVVSSNVHPTIDKTFIYLILAIGICYIASLISNLIRGYVSPIISNGISHDIRVKVYDKVQKMSLTSANNKTTGSLITRVSNDTETVRDFLENDILLLIYYAIELIILLVIMLNEDYKLTLLIIIPIPIVTFITKKIWKKTGSKYEKRWKYFSGTNNTLHDILSGIKVVKTYGMEDKEVNRFKKANADLKNIDIATERFWSIFTPIIFFLLSLGQIIIYYYVGNKIVNGSFKYGAMIKWATYSSLLYACANQLTSMPRRYNNFAISANKVMEILYEENVEEKGESVPNLQGNVKFDKVRFGYLSFTPVLKDISFEINKGETIGIVGYSGSGKTTLVNLLMKLYEPNSGKIYVDGIDISQVDSYEYRKKLGVVLQETFLFSGTIYDNIVYGNKNATYEDVIQVCKMANAHEFILKKQFGYETRLGNKGEGLSGGEKQRIAIARALLLNPSIFILDEATSSLDTITEKSIQDAINNISKGKTTFIIAHRLSTLQNASRLIVLNNGKMVEFGSHQELIDKKGYYYSLVQAQYMNYEKNN